MSIFDKLRKNATKVVDQHGDKISRGLDKAAKTVDERTGHKHSDKIRKGVGQAKKGLDRLDQKNDNDLGGPGTTPPGSTPESGPKKPPGTGSTPPSR
jgi:MT0933-like antitoxin protein